MSTQPSTGTEEDAPLETAGHDTDALIETAELKLKVAELTVLLSNGKMTEAALLSQLFEKESENLRLRLKLNIRKAVRYIEPYYWVPSGSNNDGPFCQRCYDTKEVLVRLQECFDDFQCTECNTRYSTPKRPKKKPNAS